MAPSLADIGPKARELEQLGYDGLLTAETGHDAFLPIALAAEHTERIQLTTAVAIAFARNPMTLAQVAYDLQLASHGRFRLGLGTQIKPHIEKRFSMPWSRPAARMRELVLAIRAIWASWHEGKPLDFRGEFYTHTLMTPFFNPGRNPYGLPRVFLGGVGPQMTEVAGEVADGSQKYLRLAVLVRRRREERSHQRVLVELAVETELRLRVPRIPDRVQREDVLAHTTRGV